MTERIQVIDGDRVFCVRRRRDVDLELCLVCRDLREIRPDGNVDAVICEGETKNDPALSALLL